MPARGGRLVRYPLSLQVIPRKGRYTVAANDSLDLDSLHPLVSIIVPVCALSDAGLPSQADLLQRTLTSCLEQSYRSLELLVVTTEVGAEVGAETSANAALGGLQALSARDPRLRILRARSQAQRCGRAEAITTGLDQARGLYVLWVSVGDRLQPHAVTDMAQFLDVRPDLAAIYADYDLVGADGRLIRSVRVVDQVPQLLRWSRPIVPGMVRRGVCEQVGAFDGALSPAEDYDYWLRILAEGRQVAALHRRLAEHVLPNGAQSNGASDATAAWASAAEKALTRALRPRTTPDTSTGDASWHALVTHELKRRRPEGAAPDDPDQWNDLVPEYLRYN